MYWAVKRDQERVSTWTLPVSDSMPMSTAIHRVIFMPLMLHNSLH